MNIKTTKFHLSEVIGLNITITLHGILCAQKPSIISGILSVKNHLM